MGILDNLNPMQKEAVQTTEGPLLILAGAGSGKTRVLTHRIAYMIEKGIKPWEILAITFTNKAAREMKERAFKLMGEATGKNVWIGTFHSICVRILKREIDKIGFGTDFVIYDSDDQKKLINQCLDELNINPKLYSPGFILGEISDAKDEMIEPHRYAKMYGNDVKLETVGKVYEKYQNKLKANNALDFDDIIMKTVKLFTEYEDVLGYYQNKFRYILVDEYQDTNTAQYTLIALLAEKYKNLCVVGDDDQCIYGWRGANIHNILNFESDFDNTTVIKLEENYRSTQNILNGANEVVKNNLGRKIKKLWTGNAVGEKIVRYTSIDEKDEARFVVGTIKKFITAGTFSNKDFAVLYRTNAQSRVFEEELLTAAIPYKIFGGLNFYSRKEIKDIMAYLKYIININDNLSFERIINEPKRGIGATTIKKLLKYADEKDTNIYEAIDNSEEASISQGIVNKLKAFKKIISDLRQGKDQMTPNQIINLILDSTGYLNALENENTTEASNRIENLKEFMTVALEFEKTSEDKSLEAFIDNISLVSDIDSMDEDNVVTLMTLHSAKGLEFPCVFLVGLEEGIFPTGRAFDSPDKIEEERRLCYVGMTRAMKILYMTNANQRFMYGRHNVNMVSRFIDELPGDYISDLNKEYIKSMEKYKDISERVTKGEKIAPDQYYAGQRVRHEKFGEGVVVTLDDKAGEVMVTVAFERGGIRKLMVQYANLEAV